MALSDSFVNIAKNAAASSATGFVSSVLGGSSASRGKGSLPPALTQTKYSVNNYHPTWVNQNY